MDNDIRIEIPKSGLDGLKILIGLGPEGVGKLCRVAGDLPLTLNLKTWTRRLSSELSIDAESVLQLVMGALLPLNHLRVDLKLETPELLEVVSGNLENAPPPEWRVENLEGWNAIRGVVAPLFERDNFFSIASKSYQLLLNRPNPVHGVKILSELRPVYSEDATSVKAFVLAKTLVVDYYEGSTKKAIYLSMNMDDLRSLSIEVDRARLKTETVSDTISDWGGDLISYGEQG